MSRRHQASEDTDGGFLRRWSRRKAEPEAPAAPPTGESAPGGEATPAESPDRLAREPGSANGNPAAEVEGRVMTDDDMPGLDTIAETTDMSGFFSPGVSEALRTQALRRLFRLPKFNVTDGLDDYNEDYRNFQALGDVVTSDMRHAAEGGKVSDREPREQERALADERDQPDEASEESSENRQLAAGHEEADESPATGAPDEVDSDEPAQREVDT